MRIASPSLKVQDVCVDNASVQSSVKGATTRSSRAPILFTLRVLTGREPKSKKMQRSIASFMNTTTTNAQDSTTITTLQRVQITHPKTPARSSEPTSTESIPSAVQCGAALFLKTYNPEGGVLRKKRSTFERRSDKQIAYDAMLKQFGQCFWKERKARKRRSTKAPEQPSFETLSPPATDEVMSKLRAAVQSRDFSSIATIMQAGQAATFDVVTVIVERDWAEGLDLLMNNSVYLVHDPPNNEESVVTSRFDMLNVHERPEMMRRFGNDQEPRCFRWMCALDLSASIRSRETFVIEEMLRLQHGGWYSALCNYVSLHWHWKDHAQDISILKQKIIPGDLAVEFGLRFGVKLSIDTKPSDDASLAACVIRCGFLFPPWKTICDEVCAVIEEACGVDAKLVLRFLSSN